MKKVIPLLESLFRLNSIREFYVDEAERCFKIKALLAGCVMLGAAIEASLLILIESYPKEVINSKRVPKDRKGKIKPTKNWHLIDLLNVADDLNWLSNNKKYKILSNNDISDLIPMIRDYIHPANYILKYPLIVTDDHYYSMFEELKIINELLSSKIKDCLIQHLT